MTLPRFVSIPLSQEADSIYKSLVKVGDVVKEGDVIAEAEIAPGKKTYIHSSVPGKVVAIEPVYAPDGKQEFALKIQFGGAFSYLGKKEEETVTPKTDEAILLEEIRDLLKKRK